MGTAARDSTEISPEDISKNGGSANPEKLDAGALFVLKSEGSWLHCGYHLTTAIVSPALLSLPFAFTLLGWSGGVLCLTAAGLVTFYAYYLLSVVLEHYAQLGKRHLCFQDMAHDILGPGWGRYFVGPLQLGICYGAVIARTLLGGQSLKYIYLVSRPNGSMQLYQFIIMFGGLTLIMAQMPSFHSLRHINLVSLFLCLIYCTCTTAGAIYIGYSRNAPSRDYSITGVGIDRAFGVFNAISIITTTYGNGIIPEIQATIAPPVTGKMFKGLLLCYSVVISTFFSVAIAGYWAFGNQSQGSVLSNFMANGKPLLPKGFLVITYLCTFIQVTAVTLVYLLPTNVVIERQFADPNKGELGVRNVVPRLIFRSLSVIIATTLAAMLPFFGDIMALFRAIGYIPLDFILPMIFYNVKFKPSKGSFIFWGNSLIAVISTMLAVVGAVASVRHRIIFAANIYKLFANM
ncbi:GABA transporter 1-like [Olea europaea subsp. europaea]|uniref:GABA transporter 1-like n=1 Tax=Olea europaea subsp. europaea TaxID=158383 RepID=A0A8S0S135_OLEEU|nr:GABA transporter 1-like [Olea europaea subsp. europaea]